jgi:CBS domain-containing protein
LAEAVVTSVETASTELAVTSFQAFCDDLGAMFGCAMSCEHKETRRQTIADMRNSFGKLAAVNAVKTHGALNGQFSLVFDRKGVFTLAGVIVMLPEERINQLNKTGGAREATEMADAVREAGNLLVGSWDRIFREQMPEHGHFVRGDVFIGDPWADSSKNVGVADGQDAMCVTFTMKVEPFAPFACAAVYPASVFEKPQPVAQPEAPAAVESQVAAPAEPQPADAQPTPQTDVVPAVPAMPEAVAVPAPDAEIAKGASVQTVATATIRNASFVPVGTQDAMVRDLMTSDVIWVEEDAPVGSVFEKMESRSAAYAIVGKEGRAAGVVSRYDLAGAISPYLNPVFARWRRPQDEATLDIKVKWIMSKPVRMISAGATASVAAARMMQWRVGCLPVTNDSGTITGIVTRYDLMKLLLPQG